MKKSIFSVLAVILVTAVAQVNAAPIVSDAADQQWRADGSNQWEGQSSGYIGTQSLVQSRSFMVLPFLIPVLPAGHEVTQVDLSIFVESVGLWEAQTTHMDIWGVRTDASSATQASDINGTLIADDQLPLTQNGVALGAHTFSTDGMKDWIQGIYDADPSAAGKYAFITLGPDAPTTVASRGFDMSSGNNNTEAQRPTLDITTAPVPEPATAAILGLGALIVMMARRRIRK